MKDQNRLNLSGINTVTASITDYKVLTAKLARVVVAFSGRQTRADLIESLAKQLKYNAAPVEGSFRPLTANSMVGYVRTNTELRPTTEQELRASYKVVASSASGNILMSNDDSTLWEVRTGASGMFLARKGQEDLGALVESAVNRRHGVPRLSQVVSAGVAQPREFVAFASESGDMDYGFCVQASKDGTKLKVVSSTSGRAEVIKSEQVASVLPAKAMSIPREAHNRVVASGINRDDVNQQVEYYSRLYGYAPEYLNDVIRQVEETAAM
jgi:hypothetical protein